MKTRFQGEFLRKYHVGSTKMRKKKRNKRAGSGCLRLVLCVAALFLSLWFKSCHILAHLVNGAAFQDSLTFASIQACWRVLSVADLIIDTSADT